MRLKEVKEQPLLTLPEDSTRWEEITGGDLRRVRGQREELVKGEGWGVFMMVAASMRRLSLEPGESLVRGHETQARNHLLSLNSDINDWDYLTQLNHMRECGFDMGDAVRGGNVRLQRYFKNKWGERNYYASTRIAAHMKLIGLETPLDIKENEPEIRQCVSSSAETQWWYDVTHQLWAMNVLGMDVGPEIKKYGGDMREHLRREMDEGKPDEFILHARRLHDLGILTPKKEGAKGMPPLREFRG